MLHMFRAGIATACQLSIRWTKNSGLKSRAHQSSKKENFAGNMPVNLLIFRGMNLRGSVYLVTGKNLILQWIMRMRLLLSGSSILSCRRVMYIRGKNLFTGVRHV